MTGILISPEAKSSFQLRKANFSMGIAILSIVDLNASCKSQPSANTISAFVDFILKHELKPMENITEGGKQRRNKSDV
jgi:hypothetical protein